MTEAGRAGARRFSVAEMDALVWHRDERLVWAETARASSSYGSGWSADAVVGRPDVYPRCGDIAGAWAPATFGGPDAEWIEVDFEGASAGSAVPSFVYPRRPRCASRSSTSASSSRSSRPPWSARSSARTRPSSA